MEVIQDVLNDYKDNAVFEEEDLDDTLNEAGIPHQINDL
jgi:hypothetical protein